MSAQLVPVVAAAIVDEQGRVLIARRPPHVHQGDLWEFPGGKVEAGESARQALARELREELGIEVQQARPLIRVTHHYPDKSVRLDVWRVDGFGGDVPSGQGQEGQPLAWEPPAQLGNYSFPAANLPIIRAVQLPDYYLVTPDPGDDAPAFLRQLECRLRDGIRLVQLRAKSLSAADYSALATQCARLCENYDAFLMLNADPALVASVGARGVHLDSGRLGSLNARPLPAGQWVSASCHSHEQLEQARALGADFVMISPVSVTASHPDVAPLGWDRFQSLAELAACPVFALGGMSPSDVTQAWAHGAQGIAAIRALWEH
ncbi:MAG: Nudix family hydrolase [Gammaproteobacteria bacterium]|nr:Nudix family hydrolase [Gammaproteobacteria bacterium]